MPRLRYRRIAVKRLKIGRCYNAIEVTPVQSTETVFNGSPPRVPSGIYAGLTLINS